MNLETQVKDVLRYMKTRVCLEHTAQLKSLGQQVKQLEDAVQEKQSVVEVQEAELLREKCQRGQVERDLKYTQNCLDLRNKELDMVKQTQDLVQDQDDDDAKRELEMQNSLLLQEVNMERVSNERLRKRLKISEEYKAHLIKTSAAESSIAMRVLARPRGRKRY
jgi:hypothetical protein